MHIWSFNPGDRISRDEPGANGSDEFLFGEFIFHGFDSYGNIKLSTEHTFEEKSIIIDFENYQHGWNKYDENHYSQNNIVVESELFHTSSQFVSVNIVTIKQPIISKLSEEDSKRLMEIMVKYALKDNDLKRVDEILDQYNSNKNKNE